MVVTAAVLLRHAAATVAVLLLPLAVATAVVLLRLAVARARLRWFPPPLRLCNRFLLKLRLRLPLRSILRPKRIANCEFAMQATSFATAAKPKRLT